MGLRRMASPANAAHYSCMTDAEKYLELAQILRARAQDTPPIGFRRFVSPSSSNISLGPKRCQSPHWARLPGVSAFSA
jgi:hypothetical protein